MNLIHLASCDGTDPDRLTRFELEGRKQAMLAIEALRRYTPGCEHARLRNFGMTIGIRDTRKIDALYNLTEAACASRVDSTTASASTPSSSTATACWCCRRPGATCKSRTGRCCRRRSGT
jgi:hypothetical protein